MRLSGRKRLFLILGLIVLLPVTGLAILSITATRPTNLGVEDGRLADCPNSPNCISTQAGNEQQRMSPIPFEGTREEALARLKAAITTLPRTTIITVEDDYLHVESTSRIFRFVDDVEFYLDDQEKLIHFRSAARSGHSDFGVNRSRMEKIRDAFAGSGAMSWRQWYDRLAKPEWTPAPSTIGLIWAILYPIIVVSFGFVFIQAFRQKLPWGVALPFLINLIANLLFMPLFSGLRSVPLATLDIVIVWATIIWMVFVILGHYRWVALAQVPYFVWVSIASTIQLSIAWMNR